MSDKPEFDQQAVHKYFSAYCFNKAWDLIDKPDRSPQDDEDMLRLNQASHWHWTQREDYTAKNASIGYWQTSRIYALLGNAGEARRYGQLCLQASQEQGVRPFYMAYAYEALARAEALAGDVEKLERYKQAAREAAEKETDVDDRKVVLDDLETISIT